MNVREIANDVRVRLEVSGGECGIDEVVALCPDLKWNKYFSPLIICVRQVRFG